MKKLVKILVVILIAVPIILAGVTYFILPRIDWNYYKGVVEAEATKAVGTEVTIGNVQNLRLFPRPSVEVDSIRVNAHFGTEPLFTADKVKVVISIIDLFRFKAGVDTLLIEEPNIHLVVNKQGAGNWEDPKLKTAKTKEAVEKVAEEKSGASLNVIEKLGTIALRGGRVVFKDEMNGKTYDISGFDFELDGSNVQRVGVQGGFVFNEQKLVLDGTVNLSDFHTIPMDLQARVNNSTLDVKGTLAGVTDKPSFKGDVNVNAKNLQESINRMANFSGADALPDFPFTLKGALEGNAEAASFRDVQFAGLGASLNGSGSVTLGKELKAKLNAALKIRDGKDFLSKVNTIAKLQGDEALPVFPFTLDMAMEGTEKRMNFPSIDATLAGKPVKGKAAVGMEGKKYLLEFSGNAAEIDLNAMNLCGQSAGQSKTAASTKPETPANLKEGTPWSTDPIDVAMLRQLTLNVQMQVGKLLCDNMIINNLNIAAKGADGVINVDKMEMTMAGGSFKGGAQLNAKEPTLRGSLNMDMVNLSVQEFLPSGGKVVMDMPLNAKLKTSFSGNSVAAIMGSLAGDGQVKSEGGTIRGIPFDALKVGLKTLTTDLLFGGTESYSVTELNFPFLLERGVMQTQMAVLSLGEQRLTASGMVDLGNWKINMSVKPNMQVKNTVVTIPLKVSGSLNGPSVMPDMLSSQGLGAAAGTLLGGPLGTGVGAAVGSFLSGGNNTETPEQAHDRALKQKQAQDKFIDENLSKGKKKEVEKLKNILGF